MKSARSVLAAAVAGLILTGLGGKRVRDAGGAGGDQGGGSQNGLMPYMYHGRVSDLNKFLLESTSVSKQQQPQPATIFNLLAPDLLHPEQPHRLVQDAIGCALRAPTTWWYPSQLTPNDAFHGEGLMTPPSVPVLWPGDIPDQGEKQARLIDIHTCLVARLNAFGKLVPIFLSGPHVTPRAFKPGSLDDPERYPFFEAIWLATFNQGGGFTYDVWPLQDVVNDCNVNPDGIKKALQQRVCDAAAITQNLCGLTVHPASERSRDCVHRGDGVWECTLDYRSIPLVYKPAIQTRLGPCAWNVIYGPSPVGTPPACKAKPLPHDYSCSPALDGLPLP